MWASTSCGKQGPNAIKNTFGNELTSSCRLDFWGNDLIIRKLFVVGLLILSQPVSAAYLRSTCSSFDSDVLSIQGDFIDEMRPVGSISKIFTSVWALNRLGHTYRFSTYIHLKQGLSQGAWNLHFSGTVDPLFGRESLQFIVSELNRRGIQKISLLTFDENFKYYDDVRSNTFAQYSERTLQDPTPEVVAAELTKSFQDLNRGWDVVKGRAAKLYNMELPGQLGLIVENISHVPAKQMPLDKFTTHMEYKSAPMTRLLKEINRNSNNYAANHLFAELSKIDSFESFAANAVGAPVDQFLVINGSGLPWVIDGQKIYNQASCRVELLFLKALKDNLYSHRMRLKDILPVAGDAPKDPTNNEVEGNTLGYYTNDLTTDSIIAKTGTVNPAVSLTGAVPTRQGLFFFSFNAAIQDMTEASEGRALILESLKNLITPLAPQKLKYEGSLFLPFDQGSGLVFVNASMRFKPPVPHPSIP